MGQRQLQTIIVTTKAININIRTLDNLQKPFKLYSVITMYAQTITPTIKPIIDEYKIRRFNLYLWLLTALSFAFFFVNDLLYLTITRTAETTITIPAIKGKVRLLNIKAPSVYEI